MYRIVNYRTSLVLSNAKRKVCCGDRGRGLLIIGGLKRYEHGRVSRRDDLLDYGNGFASYITRRTFYDDDVFSLGELITCLCLSLQKSYKIEHGRKSVAEMTLREKRNMNMGDDYDSKYIYQEQVEVIAEGFENS